MAIFRSYRGRQRGPEGLGVAMFRSYRQRGLAKGRQKCPKGSESSNDEAGKGVGVAMFREES